MTDPRTLHRGLFVVACLLALASARCKDGDAGEPAPNGQDAGSVAVADGGSGEDGAVDAGDSTCSPDVQTDPKNCGRCGHDCLGGACAAGMCQPVVLASDQLGPTEIAIDATHVYFTNAGTNGLLRVPIQGGAVETLVDQQATTSNLVVDDTSVYFVNAAAVQKLAKAGMPDGGAPETLATLSYAMPVIAADATQLYITTGKLTGATFIPGNLYAVSKLGGSSKYLVNTGPPTTSMAVDDVNVYFTTATSSVGPGRVIKVVKGGASAAILQLGSDPAALLADGTNVYWANTASGSIKSIPKPTGDAGAPAEVASGQEKPARIVTDAVAIYWSNTGGGTIASCPLSGCAASGARAVATNQAAPVGIAVDAVAIYWASSGNGTIMKVAK